MYSFQAKVIQYVYLAHFTSLDWTGAFFVHTDPVRHWDSRCDDFFLSTDSLQSLVRIIVP